MCSTIRGKAIMLSKPEKESILNDCEVDITESTISLCEMVERAVLAKASQQVHGEPAPIYQIRDEFGSAWIDTNKAHFDLRANAGKEHRIVFSQATPAPKQEPIAELDEHGNLVWSENSCDYEICTGFKFYARPPQAEAIPEEMIYACTDPEDESTMQAYARGWNACRAAMLSAAPKPEGE